MSESARAQGHDELFLVAEPRVMVLAAVEAGRLACIGSDGLQLGVALESPAVSDPMQLAGFLAGIYIMVGRTEFSIEDLALVGSDKAPTSTRSLFKILHENLPPQVLIKDEYRGESTYRFGDFAIATQCANTELCDLTIANQALWRVGDKQFLLELQPDDKDSLMATRVMMALAQLQQQSPEADRIHRDIIISAVWNSMPARERQIYTSGKHTIHGAHATPSAVNYIGKTLNTISGMLGITTKASTTQERYRITDLPLVVLVGQDMSERDLANVPTVVKQGLDWKIVS